MNEQVKIKKSLQKISPPAHRFFVDTNPKECTGLVSVDDFVGEPQKLLL